MPTPVLTPSLGGFLSPTTTAAPSHSVNIGQPMVVSTIPMKLLIKGTTGGVVVNYCFICHSHPRMVGIKLTFSNLSTEEILIIKLGSKSHPTEFPGLSNIPPDQSRSVTLGIDYNDTTQAAKLDFVIGSRPYTVISFSTFYMSQMTFTQEQVTVQVYTVYSLVTCYYLGQAQWNE
jgi:AP-3 complex subunit beta